MKAMGRRGETEKRGEGPLILPPKAAMVTHNELILLASRWLKRRCSIVFSDFATSMNETPDVIGWRTGEAILIECKVERRDFLKDCKKIFRQYPYMALGQRRFYLCPPGIIELNDLPKYWGLLWASKNRISIKQKAMPHPEYSQAAEIRFLVSMLRRTQIRIGKTPLSEWLRFENMRGFSAEKIQEGTQP